MHDARHEPSYVKRAGSSDHADEPGMRLGAPESRIPTNVPYYITWERAVRDLERSGALEHLPQGLVCCSPIFPVTPCCVSRVACRVLHVAQCLVAHHNKVQPQPQSLLRNASPACRVVVAATVNRTRCMPYACTSYVGPRVRLHASCGRSCRLRPLPRARRQLHSARRRAATRRRQN